MACGQRGRAGPACSLGNPYAEGDDPPEEPLALSHPIQRRHNPAGSPARAAGGSGGSQGALSEGQQEEVVVARRGLCRAARQARHPIRTHQRGTESPGCSGPGSSRRRGATVAGGRALAVGGSGREATRFSRSGDGSTRWRRAAAKQDNGQPGSSRGPERAAVWHREPVDGGQQWAGAAPQSRARVAERPLDSVASAGHDQVAAFSAE